MLAEKKWNISRFAKNITLFLILLAVVCCVNQPTLSFNMLYQEQPSIYIANQNIKNWQDLLNIYLHPMWLHINVPFFRPSGHYLIYQLITPFLGWHNIKAFTMVNLIFLTGIGFFFIKLYRLFFPGFSAGAYIGFSLYLMHPSLSLARLTIMHFDFAYVFFLMLSCYLFVLFFQLNEINLQIKSLRALKYLNLFGFSLFFFAVAITFKEPAIMLGPVLFSYYCISIYRKQSLENYFKDLTRASSLFILFSLFLTSAILSWYLFLSWPSLIYAKHSFNISHSLGTANILLKDIFSVKRNLIPFGDLPFQDYAWRTTIFSPEATTLMWVSFWSILSCALFIVITTFANKNPAALNSEFNYSKSLIFLFIASLLFIVLPLCWASGAPWHHSLTLICYSMLFGFSLEYWMKKLPLRNTFISLFCISFSLYIAAVGIGIQSENNAKYMQLHQGFLGIQLNRNALLNPPNIKNKLNNDSVIVVEDSSLHNDYFIGNAAYPFLLFFTNQDYDLFKLREKHFALHFDYLYSGNLFRYAYLMPKVKEELYPFTVEKMHDVPNEILYNWLQHFNNIFCLGYDALGVWHDKTELFKKNLVHEQLQRHLIINRYATNDNHLFIHTNTNEKNDKSAHEIIHKAITKKIISVKSLPFPDKQLCEFTCDQNKQCGGFVFNTSFNNRNHHYQTECYYYQMG